MNVDNLLIEELTNEIISWSNFYIIANEKFEELAIEFQENLDNQNISSFFISNEWECEFEEGDCILAISPTGEDEFILDIVKLAKSKKLKVYGISSDLKSNLALLSDECFFISENFRENTLHIINRVNEKLSSQINDFDRLHIARPAICGPEADSDFYISFSHRDVEEVFPELMRLHERGYNLWFNEYDVYGKKHQSIIEDKLSSSSLFIVFISPNAVESERVREEIFLALSKNIPILQIYLERTELDSELKLWLLATQSIFKYEVPENNFIDLCINIIDNLPNK